MGRGHDYKSPKHSNVPETDFSSLFIYQVFLSFFHFFCISLKSLEKNEFIAGVFSTWIINSQFILSRKAHVTFMFSTYKKYFYKAPVKSFGIVGKKGDEPETPTLFLIFS